MNDSLSNMLRKLRLSGLAETLEVRLHEARGNSLTHAEFLELILQDEMLIRQQRQIGRRVKSATFRDLKSLEEFDWSFNPSAKKSQFYELATGHFIGEHRDVLLCGPPGTGKSHLVQGVGYHLIKLGYVVRYRSIFDVVRDFLHDEAMDGHERIMASYLKPDLLIIDDFGMKQLPKRSGEFLFEIVMRRYETRSTMMTTNRPLEDWGKLLGDVPTASAILDRFLHHSEIITITGRSYRLRDRAEGSKPAGHRPQVGRPTGSKKTEKEPKPAKAPTGSGAEQKKGQSKED
jgi:DNA replication protein DnaC